MDFFSRVLATSLLVLLLLCVTENTYAAEKSEVEQIRYNVQSLHADTKQDYYIDVLKLALDKSENEFGPFVLMPVVLEMPQGRTVQFVAKGEVIDVVWTMTSLEREDLLQAVYIPLMKGLMGYRIAIIRQGEQSRFTHIETLNDFKKLTLGQGQDWPDTHILQSQGFTVMKGKGEHLIDMLLKGRFDAFPRALHEPWGEIEGRDDITLETSLLIKYTSPIYFFVNKDNLKLAERIEKGLMLAIEDGSFNTLFASHQATADVLHKANLGQRKVFEVHNPSLSSKSRELKRRRELWLFESEKVNGH